MKKIGYALVAIGLFLAGVVISRAQTPNNPFQLSVSSATHTACTVVAGQTSFCFANDGLWQSIAGAAYVQVAPVALGVVSFNGRTGVVVPVPSDYPDAVVSVNGKTGA